MGIWDYISSTSNSVKGLCLTSYGYGCAAVAKVDGAVRTKVIQPMQDEEARSKVGRIATNFAKSATVIACEEGLKIVPGGTSLYKIVSQSLRDEKKSGGNEVEPKALQAKISKLEEEIKECKKLIERAEIQKPFADFKLKKISSFESNVDIKPEDVIRVYMMNESIGRQFLDDLIVPSISVTRKNSK